MKKNLLIVFSVLLLCLQSKSMTIYFNGLDDACNEGIGWIEAGVSGGVSPYNFVWSNGYTSSLGNASKNINLIAGTYSVTVYDAAGDSATNSFSISNAPNLDRNGSVYAIFSAIDPISGSFVAHPCPGESTGHMYGHLEIVGGVSPYGAPGIMNIFNPVTGIVNMNAMAGINIGPNGEYIEVMNLAAYDQFTIVLSDAGGCPGTFTDQIFGPDNYIKNVITTLPACNGLANGTAMLNYTGTNPWPLDITLYDSTTNAMAATVSMGFPNLTISPALPAGVYRANILYINVITPCDTNFYITVADAGTNCGTISGKVYVDSIHNCTPDVNEPGLPTQLVELTPGPYYATTDASGNFSFNVPYGSYTVAQVIPNYSSYMQNYFPVCNPAVATINGVTTTATGNIGDSANIVYDLSIGLTSTTARPGFNFHYGITVQNNSFISGTSPLVTLIVDPILTFGSCNFPYTDLGGGVYTVQLGALNAFNAAQINFYFTVPPNPALIGTAINANVTLSDVMSENNMLNNVANFIQTISGSFDPNDKMVLPDHGVNNIFILGTDTTFQYTIRFQNTGTDTAFNIMMVDTLDANLDISTLNINAASHDFHWAMSSNNILKFYFDNVLLPDSTTDEMHSNGSVTYSIAPLNPASLGATILNTAYIYFDFNPPVATNVVSSLVVTMVGVNEAGNAPNKISVIPNPANNFIKIILNDILQNDQYILKIFNLQGQEVLNIKNVVDQKIISLQQLASGCYFYRLEKDGIMIEHTQGKIILNK